MANLVVTTLGAEQVKAIDTRLNEKFFLVKMAVLVRGDASKVDEVSVIKALQSKGVGVACEDIEL